MVNKSERERADAIHVVDGMIVSHLPYGPTAYFGLANVVMRHDIENHGTVSEQYPHLIFHNFSTKLGDRVWLTQSTPSSQAEQLVQVQQLINVFV
jgi:rRNA maturation protein Rpf1